MLRLSTALRAKMLGSTGFAGAFSKGVIYIYTGYQPATADAAKQGTLLGMITVNGLGFTHGVNTNGLSFDAPTTATVSKAAAETWKLNKGDGSDTLGAAAAGTAGWFRICGNAADAGGADGGGGTYALPRLDGSIGVSGADLNLPNINFVIGTPVTIDVFQFTLPAS